MIVVTSLVMMLFLLILPTSLREKKTPHENLLQQSPRILSDSVRDQGFFSDYSVGFADGLDAYFLDSSRGNLGTKNHTFWGGGGEWVKFTYWVDLGGAFKYFLSFSSLIWGR